MTIGQNTSVHYTQCRYVTSPSLRTFFIDGHCSRIKDPKRSLEFYTRVLGFRLLERLDFPDAKFSLYFLGFQPADAIPEDKAERVAPTPLPHTHAHCFVLKKRFSCLLLVCSARGLCTGARAAGMTRLPNLDV